MLQKWQNALIHGLTIHKAVYVDQIVLQHVCHLIQILQLYRQPLRSVT